MLIQTSLLFRSNPSELMVPTVLKIGVWSCSRRSHSGLCTGECHGGQTGLIVRGLILEALKIISFCGLQGEFVAFSSSVWVYGFRSELLVWDIERLLGCFLFRGLGVFYPSTSDKSNAAFEQHISHPLKTIDIPIQKLPTSVIYWEAHHTTEIVFHLLI